MGVFSIFAAIWCVTAFLFPAVSSAVVREPDSSGEKVEKYVAEGSKTIFLNDFNKKEIFSLEGNYSNNQFVDYDGKTYLVYFDKAENDVIYMCVKNVFDTMNEE